MAAALPVFQAQATGSSPWAAGRGSTGATLASWLQRRALPGPGLTHPACTADARGSGRPAGLLRPEQQGTGSGVPVCNRKQQALPCLSIFPHLHPFPRKRQGRVLVDRKQEAASGQVPVASWGWAWLLSWSYSWCPAFSVPWAVGECCTCHSLTHFLPAPRPAQHSQSTGTQAAAPSPPGLFQVESGDHRCGFGSGSPSQT